MEATALDKLKLMTEFADLIERCQTLLLITPDERGKYFETLNGKVHKEIDSLLGQAE